MGDMQWSRESIGITYDERCLIVNSWAKIASGWADNEIKKFPYDSLSEYYDLSVIEHDAVIDPKKIVGSNHCGYYGSSWRFVLSTGKKALRNIRRYEYHPEYYGSNYELNSDYRHWCLAKIGEEYFVCGGGNNRSLIAKYLAHKGEIDAQIIPEVLHIVS